MNPQSWVDLIFSYGPYGLLILFVFWVAPRQTKLFLTCDKNDKQSRLLCSGTTIASWLLTFLMTFYVYENWPPKTVYVGSFGIHGEDVEFIPSDQNLYISTKPVGRRLEWHFAVVSTTSQIENDANYTFTLSRGDNEVDYTIALADLKQGYLRMSADPTDPTKLRYDHDFDNQTPAIPYTQRFASAPKTRKFFDLSNWMAAYADESDDQIIFTLNSINKNFRAQGRRQLRNMTLSGLQDILKQTEESSKAHAQIKQEIARRENE